MAKTLAAQTTGYINNGGLVELGQNNTSSSWDTISVSKPNSTWRLLVEGDLPTDSTGVNMSVSFFEGTTPLFSAVGTWGIQGQSSASALKKNWKLKLKNPDTGNKLAVKIGDWFSITSITLKAYGTDRTLLRDCLTTELWRQIHSSDTGLLAPNSAYDYFSSQDCGDHTSALFSTDGFPVEVYQNGNFLGLYVLRTSADIDDYLMDDSNAQHVLIQPQHAGDMWSNSFNSTEWDFPSPSVKGYDTGDDMSQLNSDVNNSAARIINWMVDCYNGNTDFRKTYKDYLDLVSALDYIIITELSLSFDSLNNNFMLGSWDATSTKGIWHLWPYDEDETFGVAWFLNSEGSINPSFGWVTDDSSVNKIPSGQPPGIFKIIREQMRPELRARWRYLRDSGIISEISISKYIHKFSSMIDPNSMIKDLQNWSMSGWTGNQQGAIVIAQSVSYIRNIAKERIEWLDEQWGY